MKKALKLSLITLHGSRNYGSVLQAWATQRLFEEAGCEVEVADYVLEPSLKENAANRALSRSGFWNADPVRRLGFRLLKANDLGRRCDMMDGFLRRRLKLSGERFTSEDGLRAAHIEADVFCAGSDQIWNPYWSKGLLGPFFLNFAPKGARKISWASSTGAAPLGAENEAALARGLEGFDFISVREKSDLRLLQRLRLKAERVLDPVLTLTEADWRSLMSKENKLSLKNYLLIYSLSRSEALETAAAETAKRLGLKIVRVGFGREALFLRGRAVINPTPEAFLALLAGASHIITDSLHACCLAVIFGVPFAVRPPRLFPARVTEMLELLGLEGRVIGPNGSPPDKEPDLAAAGARLAAERERTLALLRGALRGNGERD